MTRPKEDPEEQTVVEAAGTPRARAETIYARYLARRAAGDEVDLGALLLTHVDLAGELRAADEAWSRASGIYAALSLPGARPPGATPAGESGPGLAAAALDSSSGKILRQLQARVPSGSRYGVLEEIARGGMGAILKVWDPDLRRHLAMKVAFLPQPKDNKATTADEERPLARFLEEAQITGQLDHPGIVPVHELGLDSSGRVYFTMQLVRGQDLANVFEMAAAGSGGWTTTRALRVILKVCEAMAYAHSKGVIHRDLKPANVMVGRFGEVYVMDWGLARVIGRHDTTQSRLRSASTTLSLVRTDRRDARDSGDAGSALATLDGDVVGTPAYMPPEQARGQIEILDERSDVYALGAILYHLLAGHMPYVRDGTKRDAYEVWSLVRSGPPEPLAEVASRAPPELVAICEKAMARERSERYSSMETLAEDLSAYLDGHVVRAYETGALAEFRKWVRRNRGTAAASAAALLAALGGLGTVVYVQMAANRELGLKNVELGIATEAARASETRAHEEKNRADGNAQLAQSKSREAQAKAQEATRERDAAERVVEFLVSLFRSPDPDLARGEMVTAKEILDRGALSVAKDLERDMLLGARMMDAMGGAYLALGLYADAEPLLKRAFEERLERLGPEGRDTLHARRMLGALYSARGRYPEARQELEATLLAAERSLGPRDPETLETLGDLAELYYRQGLYEESERFHLRAIQGKREAFGAGATQTLRSERELAILYRRLDRFEEAHELFQGVWEGMIRAEAPDHPDALRAMRDLAGNYYLWGHPEEARPLLEDALAEMQRVLGDDHPDTLICANDLANLLLEGGELRAAERSFSELLPRYASVFGPRHSFTLTLRNNLATIYYELGELGRAEDLLVETLEASKAVRGESHPLTYLTANTLAVIYIAQGRMEEGERLLLGALDGVRAAQGERHHDVHQILKNLAELYLRSQRWSEAVARTRELLDATPADAPERAANERLLDEILAEQARAGGG